MTLAMLGAGAAPGRPRRLVALAGPTRAAQAALLAELRAEILPVLIAERLPTNFVVSPGTRLTRAYGRCVWRPGSDVAEITIRCTADGDRSRWRRRGAIVGTLLHEAAHLRYRGHGPRFWALHRHLVDRAARAGVYDPTDRDPHERGRGDEKLADSAAGAIAEQAREARRSRLQINRLAVQDWRPGAVAFVRSGALAGVPVTVLALRRTRLLVETRTGRRYFVSPGLLLAAASTTSVITTPTPLAAAANQKYRGAYQTRMWP
jgi:hypothetical protein